MGSTCINSTVSVQIQTEGFVKIIKYIPESIEQTEIINSKPIFNIQNEFDFCQENGNSRTLCVTPHQYPFSAIGVLFVYYTNTYSGYGTAFLIADNVALTAAHNIYDRQDNIPIKFVKLVMEIHQGRGKIYRAVCAYVPTEYKNKNVYDSELRKNDFAILILESSEELAKNNYAKIPLSLDVKINDQVKVYGYPADLSLEQKKKALQGVKNKKAYKIPQEKYLFGSQGKIVKLSSENIHHKASTSKGNSGSPILRLNQALNKYEAVGIHTTGKKTENIGVRITQEVLIRIKNWIQRFWKGKQDEERINLIDKVCYQIVPVNPILKQFNYGLLKITPDTTTYAWKENKYRQDNANKNVCIYQGNGDGYSDWLCSSDLCDGECVFTIKVHKVYTQYDNYLKRQVSWIDVGLMDSNYKGKQYRDTLNHCVYLHIGAQGIGRPNQEQTDWEAIDCSCQDTLSSVPCLIECHVNRNQNTITWHYNGKHQANSTIPNSWKDGRKLCAVVMLFVPGDTVEFM